MTTPHPLKMRIVYGVFPCPVFRTEEAVES